MNEDFEIFPTSKQTEQGEEDTLSYRKLLSQATKTYLHRELIFLMLIWV